MTSLNDTNTTYDAEQVKEAIATGDQKAPSVDVEADYELSKEFDTASVDHTPEGARLAEAATSSQVQDTSEFAEVAAQFEEPKLEEGGDPDAYREMAKEVNPNL